jgi:glycosyltransferase involved in cell wall biosynthesis
MPTVSVIMPAYNVAPYLGGAIESVCAQTYPDLEVIVVDDGSTDDSYAVAEEWSKRDSRVRLLRQPNGGISAARNSALRASRGAVLAILDSDDLWRPDYLEAQLAVLEARRDVDLVTGNAWNLGSRLDGQAARPFPDGRPDPDLATILGDETAVFIMTVFRRKVYETIGGFDEGFRTNEDYDYWLRAAIAGFRFARNDRPLGWYRRRDDSLSASEVRMLTGVLRVTAKIRPLLEGRPAEMGILDRQAARFEARLVVAEAHAALEAGDPSAMQESLAALHTLRGGALLGAARVLARWTPGLLARAYHLRRARLEAHA